MKKAWIAYVLMITASSSATTTRMGNSRQNERLRRGLRVAARPLPDPVPAGAALCALPSAAFPSAALPSAAMPSAAFPSAALPSAEVSSALVPGSSARPGALSLLSARSARPAPLISAPFDIESSLALAPRAPAPAARRERRRAGTRRPRHSGDRGGGHGAQRGPADLEHGRARGARVQRGLLERIGNGQ